MALLRELGATKLLERNPVWPVLGPPQGVGADFWPVGEPVVHAPNDHGHLPAAHTDGDLYLHFPTTNLLVAGGVVSAEPFMQRAAPQGSET